MITRISLIILSIISIQLPASAENKLVLSSRYEIKDNNVQLFLGDIASVECDSDDCGKLSGMTIDQNLYNDGYIDRDEINSIIKISSNELFIIYGNAVRIVKNSGTSSADSRITAELKASGILVKKGDSANMILTRRGISIELYGKAMHDGRLGDIISVQLKLLNSSRTRLVKGKVSGKNQIEADL